jgi:cupin fold WbuC family metalloprotein
MMEFQIPALTKQEIMEGLQSAEKSPRRRHPKILHKPGAEFNQVFNFNMYDTYMQPHLHPGEEKIEEIYIIQGEIAVLYFDDNGSVTHVTHLKKGETEVVRVPAFTWHTYVMLTERTISYETMMGKYDPKTWKQFARWAPLENTPESIEYLVSLKREAVRF